MLAYASPKPPQGMRFPYRQNPRTFRTRETDLNTAGRLMGGWMAIRPELVGGMVTLS